MRWGNLIQRMMLDILHCAVKQRWQSSSPYTLNLTCIHSFHREISLRDLYNNGSGPGPDHKSWERTQFKEHTLIHSPSFLSTMFFMAFLYHQSKLLPGSNKKKKDLATLSLMFSFLGTERETLILLQWSRIYIKLQKLRAIWPHQMLNLHLTEKVHSLGVTKKME